MRFGALVGPPSHGSAPGTAGARVAVTSHTVLLESASEKSLNEWDFAVEAGSLGRMEEKFFLTGQQYDGSLTPGRKGTLINLTNPIYGPVT